MPDSLSDSLSYKSADRMMFGIICTVCGQWCFAQGDIRGQAVVKKKHYCQRCVSCQNEMRFNLAPHSFWLAYEPPPDLATRIPHNLKPTQVAVLRGDRPRPFVALNGFCVDTPFFKGHRLELVTIATDRRKGSHHFVVLDCWSDALRWDPMAGIQAPNALGFDIAARDNRLNCRFAGSRKFELTSRMRTDMRMVSTRFAVDSNFLCYYGTHDDGMRLGFDPDDVISPVRLLEDVRVTTNIPWIDRTQPLYGFAYTRPMRFSVTL